MELGTRRRLIIDTTLNNLSTRYFGVEERLFLEKKAGESIQHVVMKLLSWFVFYRPGLEIEASVGEHYKPDLVHRNKDLEVTHWIDCGQTRLTKLDAIVARHRAAKFTIVKEKPSELRHYHRRAIARNNRLEQIQYLAFDPPGLQPLCRLLHKRHKLVVTVFDGPDTVFVSVDGQDVEIRLFRLGAWV